MLIISEKFPFDITEVGLPVVMLEEDTDGVTLQSDGLHFYQGKLIFHHFSVAQCKGILLL